MRSIRGSSPLTRGKRFAAWGQGARPGLIPAHAGKTLPRDSLQRGRRAHPRSRGENDYFQVADAVDAGSSPLTRGKRRRCFVHTKQQGLIPAHAGKTVRCQRCPAGVAAHPRSRGENNNVTCVSLVSRGSSPLTRGKRIRAWCMRNRAGLIPAHAGKTQSYFKPLSRAWAHPRSRGENRTIRSTIAYR